jgi:hypothetical protein
VKYRSAAKSIHLSRAKESRFRPWQAMSILAALLGLLMATAVSEPALSAAPSAPNPEFWAGSVPSSSRTVLPPASAIANLHSVFLSKSDPDSDDCHPAGFRSGLATILTCHHDTARLNSSQSQWPVPSAVTVPFGLDDRSRIPEIIRSITPVSRPVPVPPPL